MMNINAVEKVLANIANEAGVQFVYIDMPMTMTNGNLKLMSNAGIKANVEFIDDRIPKALAATTVPAVADVLMDGVQFGVNISLNKGTIHVGFSGNDFITALHLRGKIGRQRAADVNDVVEQGIADVFKRSLRVTN